MEIGIPNKVDFSFSEEETQKLEGAYDIIRELLRVMRKENYTVAVSGYPDCEIYTYIKDIEIALATLDDLKDAWELRKSI